MNPFGSLMERVKNMEETTKKWGKGIIACIITAIIVTTPWLLDLGNLKWAPAIENERAHQEIKETLRTEIKEELVSIKADTKETRADVNKIKESLAGIMAILSQAGTVKFGIIAPPAVKAEPAKKAIQ